MRGVNSFLLILIATIILSAIFYLLIYAYFSGNELKNPLSIPDKIQALSSIIAIILGTGAAVGGAFATIQVAHLGLEITERQSKLDAIKFLEDRAQTAIKLYSCVLFSLDSIHMHATIVNAEVPVIDKDNALEEMAKIQPRGLSLAMSSLSAAINELISTLKDLAIDEFAMYCFSTSTLDNNSKLDEMCSYMVRQGEADSTVRLSARNLAEICAILSSSLRKIQDGTMKSVLESRLFTNASDVEAFSNEYNDASVRGLFFLGNLIFCRTDKFSNGHMYIASFGTAIIHDLVRLMPNDREIRLSLKQRYPELAFAVDALRNRFNPQDTISGFLRVALSRADRIGGLYLLEAKEDLPGKRE